jgi:hypothetical protein
VKVSHIELKKMFNGLVTDTRSERERKKDRQTDMTFEKFLQIPTIQNCIKIVSTFVKLWADAAKSCSNGIRDRDLKEHLRLGRRRHRAGSSGRPVSWRSRSKLAELPLDNRK